MLNTADLALLRTRIIRHEGSIPHLYKDQFGNWTIAVGHLCSPAEIAQYQGVTLTQIQMDDLLDDDIEVAVTHVEGVLPWARDLDGVREGVLVEMAFQLGIGHVGAAAGLCGFPHMLAACQAGEQEEVAGAGQAMLSAAEREDFEEAANDMLQSVWHRQTPARCEELSQIMRTGQPVLI